MDFRERLIKLRDENRLSQQELADMLDVTRQTVSRWESGRSYPSIPQMARICSAFAIDANEMLGCTAEKPVDEAQTTHNGAEEAQQKPHAKRKFIACVAVLAALFAAALGGLIATIVYAVKDAGYDSSATVWVVSIPQNTPMIVLCVFLALFMVLIAAIFIYMIIRGKRR